MKYLWLVVLPLVVVVGGIVAVVMVIKRKPVVPPTNVNPTQAAPAAKPAAPPPAKAPSNPLTDVLGLVTQGAGAFKALSDSGALDSIEDAFS